VNGTANIAGDLNIDVGPCDLHALTGGRVVCISSDMRLKDVAGDYSRGLDSIMRLQPKTFYWNKDSGMYDGVLNAGFIAQDLKKVIPEAVSLRKKDGLFSYTDTPVVAALVNAVKEQQAQIEGLKREIEALKIEIRKK
jgi:hypothetical protein